MTTHDQYAGVRYLVDDVQAAVDFYTGQLGFRLLTSAAPAFADVVRGPLRLLLSGPGGRQILLTDPAGNLIELFQPADNPPSRPPAT